MDRKLDLLLRATDAVARSVEDKADIVKRSVDSLQVAASDAREAAETYLGSAMYTSDNFMFQVGRTDAFRVALWDALGNVQRAIEHSSANSRGRSDATSRVISAVLCITTLYLILADKIAIAYWSAQIRESVLFLLVQDLPAYFHAAVLYFGSDCIISMVAIVLLPICLYLIPFPLLSYVQL